MSSVSLFIEQRLQFLMSSQFSGHRLDFSIGHIYEMSMYSKKLVILVSHFI